MKKIIVLLMFILVAVGLNAQDSAIVVKSASINWLDFFIDNWIYISSILLYIIYRLVPTKQADLIKAVIDWIWNLIPDNKKGGGKH